MSTPYQAISELNERSREVFRQIVESYLLNGDPVGSKFLSSNLPLKLSPASVRNVMSDLEAHGLIRAPHTSAGRLPTDRGLRLFVDGLLEFGDLTASERAAIEARLVSEDMNLEGALTQATQMLSGLSHCAGVVLASKADKAVRHVEFLVLEPGKALCVLVAEDGSVENRIVEIPPGLTPAALERAGNYLNTHIRGCTLNEARKRLGRDMQRVRAELDEASARVIEAGFADWGGGDDTQKTLIVRGRGNLLEDIDANSDLELIRTLFDDIEQKGDLVHLLELAEKADGVRIFIGSESNLYSLSGSSIIAAPYRDSEHKIIGVLGIIGPMRLNYARIVPMVDYTAQVISRFLP